MDFASLEVRSCGICIFERAGDSTGGCVREGGSCGLLAEAQATAQVDVPTDRRKFAVKESRRETGWFSLGKNDVTVSDPDPSGSACFFFFSLISLVSDPAPECVFFEHVFVGFSPAGAQRAVLHPRPRARRLASTLFSLA